MSTVHVETSVKRTGKVMQIEGMFDVPAAERQSFDLTIPDDVRAAVNTAGSQIGLIVGPSGSGKSLALRELCEVTDVYADWPSDQALIDAIDAPVKSTTGMFTAVGLGSPPAWLRPFHALSNGEQFRAGMARALSEHDLVAVDEFTSVVDRQVAKAASHAIQKAVRRDGKTLIAASCHFDVIDWLQPDWVYRPDTNTFERRERLQRPGVDLVITTLGRDAWPPFSRHHYLSHLLHGAAKCWGAWVGDECVAFNSVIPFPHPKVKDIRMGHRLVVLPDWQGLGIGLAFDNWLGEHLRTQGYRYHKTISHPALIHAFAKSPRWKMLPTSNAPRRPRNGAARLRKTMLSTRKLASRGFAYVPEAQRTSQNADSPG